LWIEAILLLLFAVAAPAYASVIAHAAAAGCTIAAADGFIAAIALQHHFSVATRDTQPFQAAGLDVINPWTTD